MVINSESVGIGKLHTYFNIFSKYFKSFNLIDHGCGLDDVDSNKGGLSGSEGAF